MIWWGLPFFGGIDPMTPLAALPSCCGMKLTRSLVSPQLSPPTRTSFRGALLAPKSTVSAPQHGEQSRVSFCLAVFPT